MEGRSAPTLHMEARWAVRIGITRKPGKELTTTPATHQDQPPGGQPPEPTRRVGPTSLGFNPKGRRRSHDSYN